MSLAREDVAVLKEALEAERQWYLAGFKKALLMLEQIRPEPSCIYAVRQRIYVLEKSTGGSGFGRQKAGE